MVRSRVGPKYNILVIPTRRHTYICVLQLRQVDRSSNQNEAQGTQATAENDYAARVTARETSEAVILSQASRPGRTQMMNTSASVTSSFPADSHDDGT